MKWWSMFAKPCGPPRFSRCRYFGLFHARVAGKADEALPLMEKAMKPNPFHPPHYLGSLGNAYRLTGRFDETVAAFEAFHERAQGFGLADLVILSTVRMDGPERARQTAERLLSARPNVTVANWLNTQFRRNHALLESEADASRASGLPDQ